MSSRGGQPRMGRPYRAPTDLTAPSAGVPEQRPRIAWLLGTNRLLRLDGAYAHRRDFLAALTDHGVTCDESKLSRWESGAAPVPDEAVRAYEEVLGLEPQSLRSAIGLEIDPARQRCADERSPQEVDRLITTMLAGNATGQEWIELTDELLAERQIYLRANDWSQLTTQLLSEKARATGTAYVSRTVAANRLASHPAAQPHVVRSVGAIVLDERVRRRGMTVRILAAVRDPRAWALMLRLCTTGALPVRLGAVEVALRRVGDEPRSRAELATLERALAQLLEEMPGDRQLLWLAEQLPEPSPQFRSRLQSFGSSDPAQISSADRAVAAGVARAAQERLHEGRAWDGEPDPMLAALTEDALFHPTVRRVRAAYGVLNASPYRSALAAAALELAGRSTSPTDTAARAGARMAHALQADDSERLLDLAESVRDVRRRSELVSALGSQHHLLAGPELARLHALQDSPEMVDASVHALGMLAQLGELHPTGDPALDARAQTMASWWRANGARVDA